VSNLLSKISWDGS